MVANCLMQCWQVLMIATAVSLSTAGLYLVLLRYCGCISVLMSTVGIESILVYSSYRLLHAASDPLSYANDPVMLSSLQISTVAMCCAAILFLLFAMVNMSRLLLAGAFITHASRALSQLKRLLVLPFISYVLLLLLFGWGILVTVCIFGAGETSTRIATISATSPSSIRVVTESFEVSTKLRWLFIYHLWGMYWSVNFILSIGEMITATAISLWYFSPENRITGLKEFEEADPVSYSANATVKYHLGTLALSSGSVAPWSTFARSFCTSKTRTSSTPTRSQSLRPSAVVYVASFFSNTMVVADDRPLFYSAVTSAVFGASNIV